MTKPLVLHAHASGPNPYKVAMVLETLEIPYEVKLWNFSDANNGVKGPVYTKINPNGRVPSIEDPNTGVTAWESMACINYILRVYDKENASGLGPGESEQAKVDYEKWTSFLISGLGPMLGQVNWYRHFNKTKNEDAQKRYDDQAYRCFGVLEGELNRHGKASVLGGDRPSAVDLHTYAWMRLSTFAQLDTEAYPAINRWKKAVESLPAMQRAYEKIPKGTEQ